MQSLFSNRFFFSSLILVCFGVLNPLEALFFGNEGAPYEEAGVLWQPVKIETPEGTCRACLPGHPRSIMSNGWVRVVSQDLTGSYALRTPYEHDSNNPESGEEFLAKFDQEALRDPNLKEYQSHVLQQLPLGAVYGVEYSFVYKDQKQVTRVYANPKGRLFALMILVTDQTLYSVFDRLEFE